MRVPLRHGSLDAGFKPDSSLDAACAALTRTHQKKTLSPSIPPKLDIEPLKVLFWSFFLLLHTAPKALFRLTEGVLEKRKTKKWHADVRVPWISNLHLSHAS